MLDIDLNDLLSPEQRERVFWLAMIRAHLSWDKRQEVMQEYRRQLQEPEFYQTTQPMEL